MLVRKYELERQSPSYDLEFNCDICNQDKSIVVSVEIDWVYQRLCIDCVKKMYELVAEELI